MPERPLQALPGVRDDLRSLPSQRLQRIALQKIADVRAGRLVGQPLGVQARTGDLSDCRKVYFDERGDRPPAYRLVYRELGRDKANAIEVVAVGPRAQAAVYATVAARLQRVPQVQQRPVPRITRPGPGQGQTGQNRQQPPPRPRPRDRGFGR